jgi:hypothetical protein
MNVDVKDVEHYGVVCAGNIEVNNESEHCEIDMLMKGDAEVCAMSDPIGERGGYWGKQSATHDFLSSGLFFAFPD